MPLPELTNISFAVLAKELDSLLKDSYFSRMQQIEEGLFKLKFHTKEGSVAILCNKQGMWVTSHSLQAVHNPKQFVKGIDSELCNKRVSLVRQHGLDRIIEVCFSEHFLIFEFFHDGNIILTNKDYGILTCQRKEEWKDRKIAVGEKYLFPSSKGNSPLEINLIDFKKIFSTDRGAASSLIGAVNIAPAIAEELFERIGFDKAEAGKKIPEKKLDDLFSEMKKIYSLECPVVPSIKNNQIIPFEIKGSEKIGKDLMEAIGACYYSGGVSADAHPAATTRKTETIAQKNRARLVGSLKKQDEAGEKLVKDAEENKKKAEFIYENYAIISEILQAVKTAADKKYGKKEIMEKFSKAAVLGNKGAIAVKEIDLKEKKVVVEL